MEMKLGRFGKALVGLRQIGSTVFKIVSTKHHEIPISTVNLEDVTGNYEFGSKKLEEVLIRHKKVLIRRRIQPSLSQG
ncbi:unnamed protein product [Arabidopsis halleri]